MLAPPPPLPPPPDKVTREMIKKGLGELFMASAARIGNFLDYTGPEQIGEIFAEMEDMAAAGELNREWINHQLLFSLPEES